MLFDNATDQDGSCRFCEVVIDLACAGILMATTAEFQHQLADICVIVTVEDRLADGEYCVLISETVHDMHRYCAAGVHGVNHEAVARENSFFIA